jgi:hypothetical protein
MFWGGVVILAVALGNAIYGLITTMYLQGTYSPKNLGADVSASCEFEMVGTRGKPLPFP